MTLEFAGPPLALPDDPAPQERDSDRPEPLHLDTAELDTAELDTAQRAPSAKARATIDPEGFLDPELVTEDRGTEQALQLDLGELEASPRADDGWGRLREGNAPARPRSVTPPPMTRDDALELVTRRSRPPSTPGLDLAGEMADRYALGDYTGALRVAELLLGRDPDDVRAQRCAESSRERLLALYTARLGSVSGVASSEVGARVPRIAVPEHEIRWLGLDHRQGFLLSRLDGSVTVDDLVDVSGMSRLEVLRTLVELVESGAVGVQ
ncbi:hypothetical protein [Sandaracinus amylolyticus]|uniref:TPR domain protein n=1 Tax=Sandaracinus amylolyticus TaxID=927083 RepID=A0A0F6W7B3_9BACT|nr:hypothetical protein [Sandaracinus amylolyticus]AKF09242.1 TPR domain protein [Sandaracinus amylolyticus]